MSSRCVVEIGPSKQQLALEVKLSNIWEKANRELKQVKRTFGNARRKEACALGAIAYYASGGKTCNPSKIPLAAKLIYANTVARWERLTGTELSRLNDQSGWTFERLSETARSFDC